MKTVLLLTLLAGLAAFAALPAFSASPTSDTDFPCLLRDSEGNVVLATSSSEVTTKGGTTTMKCSAKGVTNTTGKTIHWSYSNTGYVCVAEAGETIDWKATLSTAGSVMLTCKIRN
jgi:hypothetical protein